MNFGEIRTVVRSEFEIGMKADEVLTGINRLKLNPIQSAHPKGEDELRVKAAVPPIRTNPLDWAHSRYGYMTFSFDRQDQLTFVQYQAPFADRKQSGGWWPDEPVMVIGVDQ